MKILKYNLAAFVFLTKAFKNFFKITYLAISEIKIASRFLSAL